MNRDDVIRMAREAGAAPTHNHELWDIWNISDQALDRFFQAAYAAGAAAEREALEQIDWTTLLRQGGLVTWGDAETLGDRVIAAIRARSNT